MALDSLRGEKSSNAEEHENNNSEAESNLYETLRLEDKQALLKWKYLKYGERVGHWEHRIPHIQEVTVPDVLYKNSIDSINTRYSIDTFKIILDDYLAKKSKHISLREKQEMLKWYIANFSKEVDFKACYLNSLQVREKELMEKLEEIHTSSRGIDNKSKVFLTQVNERKVLLQQAKEENRIQRELLEKTVSDAHTKFHDVLSGIRRELTREQVSQVAKTRHGARLIGSPPYYAKKAGKGNSSR